MLGSGRNLQAGHAVGDTGVFVLFCFFGRNIVIPWASSTSLPGSQEYLPL